MLRGLRKIHPTALIALVLIGLALPMFAADPPKVAITITVSPNAVPGAAVTAKANITTNDGSTIKTIKWTQTAGMKVTATGDTTDTIAFTLPDRKTYKTHFIDVLKESPVPESTYPDYMPKGGEFYAGLQNRFTIVASSPHGVIDAGVPSFSVAVETTSGKYTATTTIGKFPFTTSIGVNAVPINVPVLLYGKTQKTYDWKLTVPTGSAAALVDATTQAPDFTPDIKGTYTVTVTDLATNKPVTILIYAGTYKGIVAGKDPTSNVPVVTKECTNCHAGKIEMFTPWLKTGHAVIFADNVNTTSNHYGESCLSCHTVGFNKDAANGGVDDAADYADFAKAGLMTPGDPTNWTQIVTKFPKMAALTNIQCDNCHGPTDTPAHPNWEANARVNLSSDLCGTCHGEPLRHGRYQQWQLSRHGNYETAMGEGTNPSCAKCHSAQGFLQWGDNGYGTTAIKVDWTVDQVHPITCVVCHDPHGIGTVSGDANDAPMRIQGDTPMLDAGFVAKNMGKAAICITCHNGRRGLRNDSRPIASGDLARAPHQGPQGDILLGQNLYFVEVGTIGNHGQLKDACVACHMQYTDPPANLANWDATNKVYGGTNHTFFASKTICAKCHTKITAATVVEDVEHGLHLLEAELSAAVFNGMKAQIRAGNTLDVNDGTTSTKIKSVADIKAVKFVEVHGQQGALITMPDGKVLGPDETGDGVGDGVQMGQIKVVRPGLSNVNLYDTMDVNVPKAGWNFFMIESDKSEGIHNPTFVLKALDVAVFAAKQYNTYSTTPVLPGTVSAKLGGGLGNGAGAVTCTTPYVYWTEMAGHITGNANSNWRTDLVARNLGTKAAALKFILHTDTGNVEGTGSLNASSLKAFENVAATIGATGKSGSLELCSDQPLLINSRTFNLTDTGTYGQSFDGQVADTGYAAGQTVSLVGLRQQGTSYRSNILFTNGGKTAAEASVTLYDAAGTALKTYTVTIPAGGSVNEVEPYKNRAAAADAGWGFANVTITKGSNVWVSGSMIDSKTNDPTTIPAKQ